MYKSKCFFKKVNSYCASVCGLFNAEWFAVYVEPSYKFRKRQAETQQLENNLKLAEELDGKVFRLTGSISNEIVSFAESKNITLILMGHSRRSRLQELFEGSIINKVIQKSDAQVLVVENEGADKTVEI